MPDSNLMKAELSALASYLAGRREQILSCWLRAVELDPQLTTPSSISRAQFNDHIPQVLDAFERRLQAQDAEDKAQAHSDQKQGAAEHGLHRWQQGYNQREAIREWGHLHYALLSELEDYGRAHPQLQGDVMPVARRALVRLCGDGVAESAARYERLQRTEHPVEQLPGAGRLRPEDPWMVAMHLRGMLEADVINRALIGAPVDARPRRLREHAAKAAEALLRAYGQTADGRSASETPPSTGMVAPTT